MCKLLFINICCKGDVEMILNLTIYRKIIASMVDPFEIFVKFSLINFFSYLQEQQRYW